MAEKKRKRGRPLKQFDLTEFHKLCELQCTIEEFAGWFECDTNTIDAFCKREFGMNFSGVFAQKRGKGKIALRRVQMQTALAGNATMLIWLGKQYLDQSDKVQTQNEHFSPNGEPLYPTRIEIVSGTFKNRDDGSDSGSSET